MIFGAGYAVLVGLLVVANHPLPVDAAGTATCGALGIGLTATAAVAMSAYRRGTRIPLGLLAAATALATGGEVLAPSDEVVIEGIRLSTGPQWLPALAESWPRLLLCAAAFLAATTWGRTWGVAGAVAAGTAACLLYGTAVPGWVLAWGVVGQACTVALAAFLLARWRLVLPLTAVAIGLVAAGVEERLVDVGTPVAMHLVLWPAYLATALVLALLEGVARRLVARVRRDNAPREEALSVA
ncbi:hypothetical protein SACE_1185 [Saccharopolyspora erythraea NRRL 2338]|uniref:Uncharacterized protein n=1 Tax=Saccharopolyspora erythraea (strain ATCC 11635 / DSM 40517 / JCM 4748 / NBRC 13426 / NCIMB 8594 / NRRL 2338) TaxID=405948 RepID=A4F8Y6_SACEN|nr:hypothetical protein N599_27785 [Saccharopolyspora erythraea D]QRK93344.1 hypothetical protein JQX30_06455 [Saccharopolyspora erythraea]CAM00511.1 hypothetical protein SACE_1185 [Saccharopolyspora erythraea NRRL 2338]